jgi:hypothetical protein
MIKNYAFFDIVTKVAYLSLLTAAFVFVAMLLMTGMHH